MEDFKTTKAMSILKESVFIKNGKNINNNEDNLKLFKINRFISTNIDIEQELLPITSDYQSYYLAHSLLCLNHHMQLF